MKTNTHPATRAPVITAIQTALRNLLAIEMEHLQLNPDAAAQEIIASIAAHRANRADPDTYDAMFNEHLASSDDPNLQDLGPATLGRLYTAWDRHQDSILHNMEQSLTDATAKSAETRLRATLEESLETVLTTASAYGETMTVPLEAMLPSAADTGRPILILGPDSLKAPVHHWYQILHMPLHDLAERGHISRALCPVQLPGTRRPIIELLDPADIDHIDSMNKRSRALPGGFTLWTHHSSANICRIAASTIRALGHNPEAYSVQYHPKVTTQRSTTTQTPATPALPQPSEDHQTEIPTPTEPAAR